MVVFHFSVSSSCCHEVAVVSFHPMHFSLPVCVLLEHQFHNLLLKTIQWQFLWLFDLSATIKSEPAEHFRQFTVIRIDSSWWLSLSLAEGGVGPSDNCSFFPFVILHHFRTVHTLATRQGWNQSGEFSLSVRPSGTPNINSHMRFFVEVQNYCTVLIIVWIIFCEKFSKWELYWGFLIDRWSSKTGRQNHKISLDRPQSNGHYSRTMTLTVPTCNLRVLLPSKYLFSSSSSHRHLGGGGGDGDSDCRLSGVRCYVSRNHIVVDGMHTLLPVLHY